MNYHLYLVDYFLFLVAEFVHDVVGGILGFIGDLSHHFETISLILSLSVDVKHSLTVGHAVIDIFISKIY